MDDVRAAVSRIRAETTRQTFDHRVAEQADRLRETLAAGAFDSSGFAVGLELEVYAVDTEERLAPLPDSLFVDSAWAREIGRHNVEFNGSPQPFDPAGVAAQTAELHETVTMAQQALEPTGPTLCFDAMWTIPPQSGSKPYLSAVERGDGITVAENMHQAPRYTAMDSVLVDHAAGEISISVPGATLNFPTILVESLTTSIQPHLQIPDSASFPTYFNNAIRTLGPLLALATNSPFLPGDLYNRVDDPFQLVEETPHELRIPIFEQTVNSSGHRKACCPRDIDSPTDIVDRVVEDWTCAPMLREFEQHDSGVAAAVDPYWEFCQKYGTYWRWIRGIIGGDAVAGTDADTDPGGSLRIEYRPLPTQPTVEDTLSLHWLTVGLLRGLVATDHPIAELPWRDAHQGFYNAVENGLAADLAWLTADGEPTGDPTVIYPELFAIAHQGLVVQGQTEQEAAALLAPLKHRWERRETPSQWKKARVRDQLAAGASLSEAIAAMQTDYNRRCRQPIPFAEW